MNGVLIIDDEEGIRDLLEYNLNKHGFSVFTAENGMQGLEVLEQNSQEINLILLDMMMPIMDGFEMCKAVRAEEKYDELIICFLTARNEDYNQVAAFEAGADDYIAKPIKPGLLISKVKALLRRNIVKQTIELNRGLVVDKEKHLVVVDGTEIQLPKKEFILLSLLHSKPGIVFERSQILSAVWGDEIIVGDRTIDVHIRKLREKIGAEFIQTIKGVGYKFVE